MRAGRWLGLAAAGAMLTACSSPKPSDPAAKAQGVAQAQAPRITQFYTTSPTVARGETALLCYGVENASAVWLEPPRQELSAALSRCVEVSPTAETTYTLTAQGADGKSDIKELKVTVGAARAKIVNVNVSALEVKPGDLVSVCYTVSGAQAVTIDPLRYRGSPGKGCATDQPRKSTTYTITALGASGDKDQERVTVRVK